MSKQFFYPHQHQRNYALLTKKAFPASESTTRSEALSDLSDQDLFRAENALARLGLGFPAEDPAPRRSDLKLHTVIRGEDGSIAHTIDHSAGDLREVMAILGIIGERDGIPDIATREVHGSMVHMKRIRRGQVIERAVFDVGSPQDKKLTGER